MKTGQLIKFPTNEASRRTTREAYAQPETRGLRISARFAYRQAA